MKVVIVSGFFNPLHGGHLDMIEAAAKLGDKLIVVVNNDKQQMVKKGKIILPEQNRARLLTALRDVDEVRIAIDDDSSVTKSLEKIASDYSGDELIFCNGGDRVDPNAIPGPEAAMCEKLGIEMRFGIGGVDKADSSTRINQALGHAK